MTLCPDILSWGALVSCVPPSSFLVLVLPGTPLLCSSPSPGLHCQT